MSRSIKISLLASAAVALLPTHGFAQTAASAADDGAVIEEIVVTAQKRAENQQDVPVAITAITSSALEAKGIEGTADIAAVTPGLSFSTAGGSAAPRIRGVGAGNPQAGNENSVATYVDGVYIASSVSSFFSFNNIEQIAVLKGPQGTLFGRNATGGLIQVTTRDPSHEAGLEAEVGYGNLDTFEAKFYATGGLGDNAAADIAVFYHNQMDGFGRNLTTGADANKYKEFSVRSKWKFELGEDTTATVAADYLNKIVNLPIRRHVTGTISSLGTTFTGGKFDTDADLDPDTNAKSGGVSLHLKHSASAVDIVSITAYRKGNSVTDGFDVDATPVGFLLPHFESKDRQFSQELQLLSTDTGPFKWVVGAYYFSAMGAFRNVKFDVPLVPVHPITTFDTTQKARSWAAFAQASYALSDQTNLTLGARYTWEKKTFDAAGQDFLSAINVTIPGAAKDSIVYKEPTWRIALDHHFSDDAMVYASYNRGFKSGGYDPTVFSSAVSFRPEKLDAYEIGTKIDAFDRHVRFNGAAYYYDYQNIQLAGFNNGFLTTANGPAAKIKGVDFDATVVPVRHLSLTAGLSVIHARLGAYDKATIDTPNRDANGNLTGGNTLATGALPKGRRVPVTPDWTLNLGVDYEIMLPVGSISVSGTYFHSDGWYYNQNNRLKQKPYDLVNASLKWKIDEAGNYSVTLWGRNLTNEAYASQLDAISFGDVVSMAQGRTYGASVGFKF